MGKAIAIRQSYRMRDVFDSIERGMTLAKACKDMGLQPRLVLQKINEIPQFKSSLDAAYKIGADMYMERAEHAIVNADEESRSGAALATARMKHCHKMAASFHRDMYGDAKTSGVSQLPTVTFNVGFLTDNKAPLIDITPQAKKSFISDSLPTINIVTT